MTIFDVCNISQLEELLIKHEYVVVKFSAEWCGPCKRIHPVYEKLSNYEKYTSVCFLHVDVDEARDICEKYCIEGMPTFILFQNSEEVSRFSGANEEKLNDMLSKCNK
jgi:thioredoxin 1